VRKEGGVRSRLRAGRGRCTGGFTLVELAVVLAIIGILVAAAVPLYLGSRMKAYKSEAVSALQEIKTIEWAYYEENNSFQALLSLLGYVPPQSSFWSYGIATADATHVVAVATGSANTPVDGQAVSLDLSSDGSTSFGATF
jgi:prepilin-type N-terminal cleavage/methylation domain-containing protein